MVKMEIDHDDLSTSSMKMVKRKNEPNANCEPSMSMMVKRKKDDDTEEQTKNDEEAKIYICCSVKRTGEKLKFVEWHVFDRNREEEALVAGGEGEGEDGVSVSPLYYEEQFLSSDHNLYLNGFGCALVDDDIYIIGGDNYNGDKYILEGEGYYDRSCFEDRRFDKETIFPLSNKVRIFNTESKNWLDFNHPMIRGRTVSVVVYVANKLFVFGSFPTALGEFVHPEPWAEYYDFGELPSTNKGWLPLENIPKEIDGFPIAIGHAIIPHTNHLLLWSFHSFALFNANDNTWLASLRIPNQKREPEGLFSPHVAVASCGSILYWYYGRSLFAYDLMENKNIPSSDRGDGGPLFTFQKPWDGPAFFDSLDPNTAPHLIAIGNKELCLIWFDIVAQRISCTDFLLQEEKDKITWSGTYHYRRLSHRNKGDYSHITHCIPVVRPPSKMHQSYNKGDIKPQRPDPEFGDGDHRVVHSKLPMENTDEDTERLLKTFANTMCDQILKCHKEEKSKKKQMLEKEREAERKKKIQNESVDEFLTKHNIKEFATVFAHLKIKDPYDMKKLAEFEMMEYDLPRASWVKLEAALERSCAVNARMS